MDEDTQLRMVKALEEISSELSTIRRIIQNEQFYVKGDIHTWTE